MKKTVSIALLFLTVGAAALFAESAELLPAGLFRFRIAPIFNFANGGFDEDGKYHEYEKGGGATKVYGTGFALEYGVLNWLSLALQWTPGWVAWSDVDQDLGNDSTVNANGVSDLFAGVAVQIVGQTAPVKSELFRFTVAPGIKIPFPGADALDQFENWKNNEAVTAANPDKHSLGLGGRAYFDYVPGILNKHLVLNLYSEFIGYPVKSKVKDYSVAPILSQASFYTTPAGQTALGGFYYAETGQGPIDSGTGAPTADFLAWAAGYVYNRLPKEVADWDVSFGYDLTFEFEVSVSGIPLDKNQKLLFAAGLPFNYSYSPGNTIGDLDAEEESSFSIKPYASLFLTNLPLPIQLQLGYNIPVAGVNSSASHVFVLQAKFFFKF
ncbi:MAG: hypothetical protein LBD44_02240 [Spirochaetaceae bacterium]|jgi:hypothetical protein|nr:hypothetical protein [Spirochaetaceae bacterium]